jgi:membrane protein implicated in regulation of membrane protease activity
MSEPDAAEWKRRLALYSAARLPGLAVFMLGIAIAYSNLVRAGGWPQVGAVLAIVGGLASILLPRAVRRRWTRLDSAKP